MTDLAAWLLEQIDWTERQVVMLDSDANMQGYGAFVRSVVADCDAKRRIVNLLAAPRGYHAPERECGAREDALQALRLLALPYANHPGYQPKWAA